MAYAVVVPAGTVDVQVDTGGVNLIGYSARETAAAVATVIIRDGTDNTGPQRVFINLAASASQTALVPAVGYATGVRVNRTAGSTELVLYFD